MAEIKEEEEQKTKLSLNKKRRKQIIINKTQSNS